MAESLVTRWIVSRPLCSVRDSPPGYRATRYLRPPWRWLHHRGQQRGASLGYAGHTHQQGEKELAIIDQHGFVLGPTSVQPVNQHDPLLLPDTLTHLVTWTSRLGIDLTGAALTLDSGVDSQANRDAITAQKMSPVIYPNRRHTPQPITIAQQFRWFARLLSRERYKVERTFGGQDTYRQLVVSDDRLPEIRPGGRLLAYAMLNYRVTFSSS